MMFAEVIGDPIAQSKSPTNHKHWQERLGNEGDYLKTLVSTEELSQFLERRRAESDWRGCNVTIPHKERIMPLLAEVDEGAATIGAVNCVVPREQGLVGFNTDIDGVAAALDSTELQGRNVAVIGAGGGARALIAYFARREVGHISILVRDPKKAEPLVVLAAGCRVEILSLERSDEAFEGAAAATNASPLGMAGAAGMPPSLTTSVARHAAGITLFDMVTTPAQTSFLQMGRSGGAQVVDGLTMLIGQARRACGRFLGPPAPEPDQQLRDLRVT
jgi:shikimate dehydrogenase